MSDAQPLLSVVIPTRNRREMALQAVQSALVALPFPHEVILSDNASSDNTAGLMKNLPASVRYVRRPELLPMAEHWNLCVSEAKGKYVKILCDDDWLIPGALEREVSELEKDSSLAAAASGRIEISSGNERRLCFTPVMRKLKGQRLFLTMLLHENTLGPPSSVTFRRDLFRGFPLSYQYAADFAAWVLLADLGGVVFLPEPGVNFRIHKGNLTSRFVNEDVDFLEVQAVRLECFRRLRGAQLLPGLVFLCLVWFYRALRRVFRYVRLGHTADLRVFFKRVIQYKHPALPHARSQ